MGKLFALLEVLRRGNAVADPRKWATGQVTVNALVPFIMACGELAKQYGVDMPLSEAAAVSLAGGLLALVNIVCTIAAHGHLGVGGAVPRTDDSAGMDDAPAAAPAAGPDAPAERAGGAPQQLPSVGQADEGDARVPVSVTDWTNPFREHGA